jgi:tetratricopeptide (TPR) repeat protein
MRNGHADAEAQFEHARDEAFAALQDGRREAAGLILWHALQTLDAVGDDDERRSLAGRLGAVCLHVGFDDIALLALDAGIELHAAAGDVRALENDRMTVGTVHFRLGNVAAAESAWRRVHADAMRNGDDANAASASTNLASLYAQEGLLPDAADLLEQSLACLAREPFPETELNTRFMYCQVLAAQGAASARVLDAAAPLGQWAEQIGDAHRSRLADVIAGAVAELPERRAEFGWLVGRF